MAKRVMMSTEGVEVSSVETAPVFEVKDNGKVLGDLTVSTGGIRWRVKHGREPVFVNWEEFDELMRKQPAKK
jgi:hypothetical protein